MASKPATEIDGAENGEGLQLPSLAPSTNEANAEQVITHLEIARLIERAHRRFLDLLRIDLARFGIDDISPSQVMLLFTIGSDELSVRDLLERGHYLGSNASYNLKQLVEADYVHRSPSLRDRRSARLRLTPKAVQLCDAIRSVHEQGTRTGSRDEPDAQDMSVTYSVLRRLEILWTGMLRYGENG
ncbi:DNA-binding MarR family transcriptional regulator [Angulomicrobium tetraedrale]|uniref:DNA-binding MarR family transcriptional regulator n=1 Tax=Ancylobacter tetraedralis TaxID=217068 RepID=A0A839ZDX6_9HYPH|nr:MarR family transcriptional regulator [Ancylobacter tetraedralis]MBB3772855.1 DNA-binding MarR family transcriptional regulator [Ancylobacter tetraedralis]